MKEFVFPERCRKTGESGTEAIVLHSFVTEVKVCLQMRSHIAPLWLIFVFYGISNP